MLAAALLLALYLAFFAGWTYALTGWVMAGGWHWGRAVLLGVAATVGVRVLDVLRQVWERSQRRKRGEE